MKKLPKKLIDFKSDESDIYVEEFEILKISKTRLYKPARYIESSKYWLNLNPEKNYLIYDSYDNELIAIIVRDKLRSDYLTTELFEYMNKYIFDDYSNNSR